jgi:hypothetical protein
MAAAKNGVPGTHERRLMESESRWLQKALFALAKAEDDRGKLAEALEDQNQSMQVKIKGKSFDAATVREAMVECVQERAEHLRAMLDQGRTALR